MTMTDAAGGHGLESHGAASTRGSGGGRVGGDPAAAQAADAAARASAVAEAHEAIWAVHRAARMLDDAAGLVVLRGQEAWLGPARDAFDARGEALRARLIAETGALRTLALAIEGAL